MLKTEKRAAISLALVYALRMLGLFMILPVFSLHANDYSGTTPVLIGLAIGIYGLTQGLFQLPFGFLSDRFGRKIVIIGGLLIFCLGSIVAAEAETIAQVIAGRALQGLGAIAAAVMALAADLTREEVRLRIMAAIGMSIGAAFMLSMVIGPVIAAEFGLRMLFWMTAGLAVLGILVIVFITPQPPSQGFHRDAQVSLRDVGRVAGDLELLKLGFGVFVLHLVLAATFVVFPLVLQQSLQVDEALHWRTYLPVFVLSVFLLVPMIIVAEKMKKSRLVFTGAVVMLALAELGLAWSETYVGVFIMLVLFFGAFNFLEAIMPTTVARIAPADMKGTAMGLFSSAQFIGAFSGGLLGGILLGAGDYAMTFLWLAAILGGWFLLALTMKAPRYLASRILSLRDLDAQQVEQFVELARKLDGVHEISVYETDQVAYLKVEKGFDDTQLRALVSH
ncbi:MAG: MFS transporter [Gammaproteobacteria bacterium]|nr:MFS transporter [Gammaproteobacteria bacterium]MDH3536268.1 MFS transporter [Gammaproteobacteria bacterium]